MKRSQLTAIYEARLRATGAREKFLLALQWKENAQRSEIPAIEQHTAEYSAAKVAITRARDLGLQLQSDETSALRQQLSSLSRRGLQNLVHFEEVNAEGKRLFDDAREAIARATSIMAEARNLGLAPSFDWRLTDWQRAILGA